MASRLIACCVALLSLATLLPLPARAIDDPARQAGQSAIRQQIEAFRRDDAAAAFAQASPAIQGMFGTEGAFVEMVKRAYKPVYRPRDYSFGPTRDVGEGFEQAVAIQDEEGVDWDAVYSFERQPDGSWKISGCRLVKRPGEAA